MYILASNYCIIENFIGIIFPHVLMERVTELCDLCFYLFIFLWKHYNRLLVMSIIC